MSLIFDRFPDLRAAERFAAGVGVWDLTAKIYTDLPEFDSHEIFPFQVVVPIVCVERPHEDDNHNRRSDDGPFSVEERVEQLGASYGGRFAGT